MFASAKHTSQVETREIEKTTLKISTFLTFLLTTSPTISYFTAVMGVMSVIVI